jgi:hypothetical protein
MREIKIVLLLIALFLPGAVRVAAAECNRLAGAASADLVSYLGETKPDRRSAQCVAFAISWLGDQREEPAVPVLTKLLDFRFPLNARQKQRLFVLELEGTSIYPAVNALVRIGKNSLPSVLEVIKSDSGSRVTRENAVSVWMQIYKNQSPVGVMLLKREADTTEDSFTRQRVAWAASMAQTRWCAPSDQAQCRAVLNTRFSK